MRNSIDKALGVCCDIGTAVRLLVLAYLTIWLSIGPAARGFHFEFSNHGHKYCPEHHRNEVVEHTDADRHFGKDHGIAEPDRPAVTRGNDAPPPTHEECALCSVLASIGSADSIPRPSTATLHVDKISPPVIDKEASAPSISRIRIAPKTSPPISAV
ncbi:MAG: hypothetical protein MUC50_14415 [Myxococcota bacterium]|nr:hypothetical protein [Myxococcota bacterium]